MSARVFNRFAMSEAKAPRGPPPGQEIERARRVLFADPSPNCNPVAQARQVAAEQLADNIKQKSQQWNFDFGKGVPLNNTNSRLQWQKQETTERIPAPYSLERLPYLSTHADSDISDNESATSSDDAAQRSSRQSTITGKNRFVLTTKPTDAIATIFHNFSLFLNQVLENLCFKVLKTIFAIIYRVFFVLLEFLSKKVKF